MSNIIVLELGDIIDIQIEELSTPTSKMKTVLVTYIDEERLGLTELDTGKITNIPLLDNRIVTKYGKHVTQIHLLSRNPLKGYALQNGLTAGKNIRVNFAGVSQTLEGEILETKNDMVTLLANDTFDILYLNFAYQGLPKNENFEITSILLVPPNGEQEKKKEKLTQRIYNYLESHPSFQQEETGTLTVSVKELSKSIIEEGGEDLNTHMFPWICRVIRNYIDQINHSETHTSTESVVVEEEEEEKEKKQVDEPIIGISPKLEMRLLEDIHSADQLLRNEGIFPRMFSVDQGERKNKKGKKLRRRKHVRRRHKVVASDGEPGRDAVAGKDPMSVAVVVAAEEDLVEHLDVPNQSSNHLSGHSPLLVEQLQGMVEDFYTNMSKENIPTDLDHLQHILQRYSELYHTYIAYPPDKNPLYESLKHLNRSIGWILPVVAPNPDSPSEKLFFQKLQETDHQFQDPYNHDPHRYQTYLANLDRLFGTSGCVSEAKVQTTLPVLVATTPTTTTSSNSTDETALIPVTYLPSESLCLLSMLTFPHSVMRYSRVYTPLTSLYEITSMVEGTHGLSLFQMLVPLNGRSGVGGGRQPFAKEEEEKEEEKSSPLPVRDMNHQRSNRTRRHVSHRNTRKRSAPVIHTVYVEDNTFPKHPTIDKQLINNYTLLDGLPNNLETLLQSVVNHEMNIDRYLEAIPNHVRGIGFSIYQLSRQLEPFQIYYDRLTVKQQNVLVNVLTKRSKQYRKDLHNVIRILKGLETSKSAAAATGRAKMLKSNYLQELAPKDKNFVSLLNRVYKEHRLESSYSPEELITYTIHVDDGEFFNFCLSASKLDRNLVRERPVPYSSTVKITQGNSQISVPPIPMDSSSQELRLTPQKELSPPEASKNDSSYSSATNPEEPLPPHVSKVTVLPLGTNGKEYCKNIEVVKIYIDRDDLLADNDKPVVMSTLLPSAREVKVGDHAVLLQGGSEAFSYYVRENDRWREDVTLRPELLYDTPAMFCNMKLQCMRDFSNKQCVSMKALSKYLVQEVLKQRSSEGNNQQVSYRFLEYLQKNELKQIERSRENVTLYDRSRRVYDHQQFELGLTRRTFDLVQSPSQVLFSSILAERNFDKRQHETLNFCMTYTRSHDPHNNLESPFWRYCVTKGIPLVPTSLYQIATLYLRTNENYPQFVAGMEHIQATCGTLSEDRSCVVDKHSGFQIGDIPLKRNQPFCSTEDYKERIPPPEPEPEREYGSRYNREKETHIIRSIVHQVSQKLGIHLTKDEPFIVRNVLYKIPPTIDEAERNRARLYLTLGMIVIVIQTSIPSVVSVKTVPHCKAVYLGYPLLDDPEEMGTIDYVACGAIRAKRKKDPLWTSVSRSIDRNQSLIQLAIDTELRHLPEVQSRIYEKRQQIDLLEKEKEKQKAKANNLPKNKYLKTHSLQEWTTFLPAAQLQTQTNAFLKRVSSLHKADRDAIMDVPTCKGLDLYVSKIDEYTLGMEAEIQEIVKKEDPQLKLDSNVPILENSCCPDIVTNSAIKYFTQKRPIIDTYLHGAMDLNDRLDHLLRTSKARPMISEINTKRQYPQIDTGISEHTKYAAFVYQAKQDILHGLSSAATDAEGRSVSDAESSTTSGVTKGKKNLVKVLDTLEENIERLKDENINYTKTQFEDLFKNRFKEGLVSRKEISTEPYLVQRLRGAIAEVVGLLDLGLLSEKSELFSSRKEEEGGEGEGRGKREGIPTSRPPLLSQTFVSHLLSAMNRKPKALSTYLSQANEAFVKNMRKNWSLRKSPEEVEKSVSYLGKAFNSNTFSTFEMFLDRTEQFIENITQVYPSIILNEKKINVEKIILPSSWDVLRRPVEETHLRDLMGEKYAALRPLYGKEGLDQILEKMKKESRPLVILAKKLRLYYQLQQQQQQPQEPPPPVLLNADAMHLLFKYFIYTIYDQYQLLGEGVVEDAGVDQMMEIFFQLFVEEKELLHQERKPLAEVVISRKQRAKRQYQQSLDSLSKEEREVHRVMRRYRIGPFHSSSNDPSAAAAAAELLFDNEESSSQQSITFPCDLPWNITDEHEMEDSTDPDTDTDTDLDYDSEDEKDDFSTEV
jgi:hypothetical protein